MGSGSGSSGTFQPSNTLGGSASPQAQPKESLNRFGTPAEDRTFSSIMQNLGVISGLPTSRANPAPTPQAQPKPQLPTYTPREKPRAWTTEEEIENVKRMFGNYTGGF